MVQKERDNYQSFTQLRQTQVKGQWPAQLALCSVPQQHSCLPLQEEKTSSSLSLSPHLSPLAQAPFCREAHVQVQVERPLERAPAAAATGRSSPER